MCGRYSLAVDTKQMVMHFSADVSTVDWLPTYSIAPTEQVPIIRERQDQRGLTSAKWGLRPVWAKEDGPRPINARIETVHSNGMFKQSFAKQRCLIPLTSYVEWTTHQPESPGGKPIKQPHAIALPNQQLLGAAGLWAAYRDNPQAPWEVTCTIITREAKDASGQVHDRMPTFLEPQLWDWWLDPERIGQPTDTNQLITSSDTIAHQLITWPISRRINWMANQDQHDASLLEETI